MRQRILVLAAVVTTLAGTAGLAATPVSADGLSFPITTVIEATPGSVIEIGRMVLDIELAGPDCTWTATAVNQESAHTGNDIIISSGGQELVLDGVEDAAGKVTSGSGSAYLVDEVLVSLRMGPDGVFSAGIDLTITYDEGCQPVPVTTTTGVAPTTTLAPTTETMPEVEPQGPTTAPPATAVPTTAAPPTTVAPAAEPVLPITGAPWLSLLTTLGTAMVVAGFAITRRPRAGHTNRH